MPDDLSDPNAVGLEIRTPRRAMLAGLGGLAAGAFLVSGVQAGPLSPPSGPITSTPGPEPRTAVNATNTPGNATAVYRITQPGSYYLERNVLGESGKTGIAIASSHVTLDLMGFDVQGVAGAGRGIGTSGTGLTDITVKDGSVGNWPDGGVIFSGNGVFVCNDLRVYSNSINGISMDTGLIDGCCAFSNSAIGLRVAQGGTIVRCFAKNNGGSGIEAGLSTSVIGCSAFGNTGTGMQIGGNSVVTHCTSQQNGANGFRIDFGSLLVDCASRANDGFGVEAKNGASVRGCTVDRNALDGILVASNSLVVNNSVTLNGQDSGTEGSGIRATGSDNRIENNHCAQNDIGIKVEGAGNILRGNSSSGSFRNYELAANNIFGAIIDRRAPASAAVSGHDAASTLGTTDPHANFSY